MIFFLHAGWVWAGVIEEDVRVEAVGAAGRGAAPQPVEVAHLSLRV